MSTITIDAPEARPLYPTTNHQTPKQYQAVIKLIVWTAGAIAVCLALSDFYAHTYAHETEIALQQAQLELLENNKDLRMSDISPYISGSPTISTRPADRYTNMCKSMQQYTWKGFFKDYSITVYVGLGKNPSIDYIHGPGDLIQSSKSKSSTL